MDRIGESKVGTDLEGKDFEFLKHVKLEALIELYLTVYSYIHN